MNEDGTMSRGKMVGMIVGGIVLAVILSFALLVWGFGLDMATLSFQKPLANKQTEITRETNQYVTTQQQLLLSYATAFAAAQKDGDSGQMKMIANQMQSVAATLESDQVPDAVKTDLAMEGMPLQ